MGADAQARIETFRQAQRSLTKELDGKPEPTAVRSPGDVTALQHVHVIWVTAIVLVLIAIYLSLARGALLSAIGRTEVGANRLSWGLAMRVGAVTVVPFAGLIASQYPEFAFWVSSLPGSVTQSRTVRREA